MNGGPRFDSAVNQLETAAEDTSATDWHSQLRGDTDASDSDRITGCHSLIQFEQPSETWKAEKWRANCEGAYYASCGDAPGLDRRHLHLAPTGARRGLIHCWRRAAELPTPGTASDISKNIAIASQASSSSTGISLVMESVQPINEFPVGAALTRDIAFARTLAHGN